MNKKYQKNIENQKAIEEKIEELRLRQEILKEEQDEMEQVEVLKEYRSIDISLDEFLEMMRNYKKERRSEKKMKEPENSKEVEENREKIMEDTNEENEI
nr:conjugal transfer protein [uncultured Lachnoanaerobaculum sp.]